MQEVVLNLLPNGVPPVCYISQYDGTSRVIRFHLLNGTEPLTLNGSETITLNFRKPDREEVTLSIENTSSNYIDLVISSELSDKHGEGFGEFRIQGLGTLSFKMYIESDAYGDSLKTRSVSGPIATFETDLAEDLIKLDVDLEPIQDLHGYDNPWPAGGGKNKLQVMPFETKTSNGITFTYNNDGTVTIDGTSTGRAYQYLRTYTDGWLKNNNTYTVSMRGLPNTALSTFLNCAYSDNGTTYGGTYGSVIGNSERTITPTHEYNSVLLDIPEGQTFNNNKIYVQIEEGSVATDWTPYSNVCPISGHDSAQLLRTGKNLFDNQYPDISTSAKYRQIKVKNGTYTASTDCPRNSDSQANLWVLEGYRTSGASTASNGLWEGRERVLTITDGYITVAYRERDEAANPVNHRTQIELGSTATDYEPYESDPTPVTVQFGQTIYKGKLYSEQRKVLVTHVGMDLGYFTWNHYVTETRNYFYSNQPPPISPKGTTSPEVNDDISSIYSCEKYADVVNGYTYSWMHSGFTLPATTKRLYIYDEAMENEDAAAFKTRVTGQQFVYEVAEPFFIDLTQVQTADIEATGVASFETTLAMPLETSEHYFSCSQAEGTPTPDSPIPITGVSEITAIRTGKNLLSPTLYKGLSYNPTVGTTVTLTESTKQLADNHDGTFSISTTANWETFCMIVPIKSVTYYRKTVISSNGALGTSEVWLDKNLKVISAYNNTDTTQTKNGLLTIPDNASYFAWVITNRAVANSTLTITQPQLELGSTATPYEPYSGESVTVSLGGTYYGGKLVQSEDGSRKIVLSHKKITLDGSSDESWNDYPTGNGFFINGINDHISESYGDGFSSTLPVSRSVSNLGIVFGIGSKYIFLMQVKTSWNISTVSDLRTFLSNNPMDVTYKLETPIEINLPDGDPLTTIAGENNVYCNTGDTALTYYYNMVADPIRIPALVGTNNVYSDAGDVDVEYYTTVEGGND